MPPEAVPLSSRTPFSAWLLSLLATLLLQACGDAGTPAAQTATAIHFALSAAPVRLDPRLASDAASERINRLLYARLVEFDAHNRPVPGIARWRRIDPLHYRFHLIEGPGRQFHDGSRLEARDVAATYRSVLDPALASPHRATLSVIERIRVIDTDTLEFTLRRPAPLFPGWMTLGIVPAAALEARHALSTRPLGSGPFRFVAWPRPGYLVLERLADRQRLVFDTVPDPTMRALKLMRGEVDMLQNDLPPELLEWLGRQAGIQVLRRPGHNFSYIGFHLASGPTADWRVRRAVALAIDRRAIIRHLFRGAARPAQSLLPPEHWAGAALDPIPYDPPRARRLLAEAGFGPGRALQLVYKTSTDPFRVRLATVFRDQLARIGIDLQVRSLDWGTFFGDIKTGRFQLYSLAWVGVRTPDIFRYAFHSDSQPPAGANRGRLRDSRVDSLIEAAARAAEPAQQQRLYRALQARLQALTVYVPLWFEDQYAVLRSEIEGYRLAGDGNYDALARVQRRAR